MSWPLGFAAILLAGLVLSWPTSAEAQARARPRGTLYVSKLGDNSDGRSWATAFTTLQAALDAIPDDRGGWRVVVRPDTYFEANLSPAHKGAAGAYNELVADFDGTLGSGRSGWVVIDSSDPGQKGFKSYDWWGPIRAYSHGWSAEHTGPTTSAIAWDRWILRRLYVTGGDGGLMFDCTDQVKPFTVIVEDCVSLGRAFGGGVASCLSRSAEPIVFRRCHLGALDWWGDTAAAYVRIENPTMPDRPDVIFEDCTLFSPQCALKANNFDFHTFSHVLLSRCRLIVLNFSQPRGTPSGGIVQSVQEGKLLHVDFRDCTLMGYKVFGVMVEKNTVGDISYTTRGDCKAYVQFQQEVPAGFHRLGHWPVEDFQGLLPSAPERPSPYTERVLVRRNMCELGPFLWHGRLLHLECVRPTHGDSTKNAYLRIVDPQTGEVVTRFGKGHSLASIIVHDDTAWVYASRWERGSWHDVTLFKSSDLQRWESTVVLCGQEEGIFNTSVCRGPEGFVMAYESNDSAYPAFTIKFARSDDLEHWTRLPEATFGTNRYTACPCLRYSKGYYYVLYLERRTPRHYFETYITRSPDLKHWELSAANPILWPEGLDEGINASDPELIELSGKTYLYFCVGDQLTWGTVKRVTYPGTLADFFSYWYRMPGIPDRGTASR